MVRRDAEPFNRDWVSPFERTGAFRAFIPAVLSFLKRSPSSRHTAHGHSAHGHKAGMSPLKRWLLIGLGVLVVGFALLAYFTTAKRIQEPIASTVHVGDPLFADSAGPLLGAEFVSGNSLQPLINGKEIFPAMLAEIRKAQKSITLESYIWASGQISDQFCAALAERASHGVKVHALVDGMGNLKLKFADIDRMKAAGVEFVIYKHEHWYTFKPDINHRSHRKLLIIDGKVGFTGGVCIDDTWLGDADREGVWRDTQARIEGPVVRQMQAVFAANWLKTTSKVLMGPDYFPSVPRAGDAVAHCFKSGPDDGPENARLAFLLAFASAQKSIKLAHAYFVPDDLAIEMLIAARKRGVEVEVVVPAKNDSRMGRAASRSRWGELLAAGVKFYQYQPTLYHVKLMIVDDRLVSFGSVNFDNRSLSLNDEVNVNVLDPAVARAFLEGFNDDVKHSKPLTQEEFENRPFWVKVADHFSGLFKSQF